MDGGFVSTDFHFETDIFASMASMSAVVDPLYMAFETSTDPFGPIGSIGPIGPFDPIGVGWDPEALFTSDPMMSMDPMDIEIPDVFPEDVFPEHVSEVSEIPGTLGEDSSDDELSFSDDELSFSSLESFSGDDEEYQVVSEDEDMDVSPVPSKENDDKHQVVSEPEAMDVVLDSSEEYVIVGPSSCCGTEVPWYVLAQKLSLGDKDNYNRVQDAFNMQTAAYDSLQKGVAVERFRRMIREFLRSK